ncbi:glyoxalase [Steroidobacter agaridevorans]|uniref:Glyoxalase n=1 Tax=Steroidobacter agaridevorans TaxID=2695856 RepID=A0A829YLL8_9GAMM|nr:VOC family protein [Steroidobacter agaridevorans]GFE83771.1 glyoxalase [Steroidobacter agaridevorans]GFE91641.1 glyoxalase [Steroidobacter agaridevorans]
MRAWPATLAVALCAFAAACISTTRLDTSGLSFSQDPLIGKVVWNDLITDDLAAVRAFYSGLFGWTYDDAGSRHGHKYVLARAGNAYVGGILEVDDRADGKPLSRWLPYVSVDDVDAAVQRTKSEGGRVAVPPTKVNLGRVAAIIDPEGAVIGLARSRIGDPDETSTAPALGRIVWTELLANNPQQAAKFYAAVVGYEPLTAARRGGEYTWLTHRGTRRAGLFENPSSEAEPVWLTFFAVDDPAASAERVQTLGGRVVLPPSPTLRDNTIAVVTDPTGAILVLQKFPT